MCVCRVFVLLFSLALFETKNIDKLLFVFIVFFFIYR